MPPRWLQPSRKPTPDEFALARAMAIEALEESKGYSPKPGQLPDLRAALSRSQVVAHSANRCMSTPGAGLRMETNIPLVLRHASLWWCSSEVKDLVDVASASMPDQPLDFGDPPSDAGLLVMESPFLDTDDEMPDLDCGTNAFLWFKDAQRRTIDAPLVSVLQIVSLSYWGAGQWATIGVESWPIGESQSDGATDSDRADRARIATVWTLAHQERVVPQLTIAPCRAVARRVKAEGLPPEAGSVRTLDVRRANGDSVRGEGHRDYTHRWIVNGHWRNQWLPSRKTHRAQWIAPYVKGPEDKPLVVRSDVVVVK